MLRVTIVLLLAIAAIEPALSAEKSVARRGWQRPTAMLPAGLPRPNYKYRTTISYDATNAARRASTLRVYPYEPEVFITPVYAEVPDVPVVIGRPRFPAFPTLSGYYYGAPYSYAYPDPTFGALDVGYWHRLPHACGLYGFC